MVEVHVGVASYIDMIAIVVGYSFAVVVVCVYGDDWIDGITL